MKIAVMQPYFFPYIGYWQLIHAADCFIVYDDVNYINKGWVNRNRILINGDVKYITLPLHYASQNKYICNTIIKSSLNWSDKLIKTLEHAYRKSPYFKEIFPFIEKILRFPSENLSDFLVNQLVIFAELLNIDTKFVMTSRIYNNSTLKGQERILDICICENAVTYINLPGGQSLYDKTVFNKVGINLCFISTDILPYQQRSQNFLPNLSIIDMLMEVGIRSLSEKYLPSYRLEF